MTEVIAVQVLAETEAIDASKAAGNDTRPLCGLPFAVRDNIDVFGYATVAGSPALEGERISVHHQQKVPRQCLTIGRPGLMFHAEVLMSSPLSQYSCTVLTCFVSNAIVANGL